MSLLWVCIASSEPTAGSAATLMMWMPAPQSIHVHSWRCADDDWEPSRRFRVGFFFFQLRTSSFYSFQDMRHYIFLKPIIKCHWTPSLKPILCGTVFGKFPHFPLCSWDASYEVMLCLYGILSRTVYKNEVLIEKQQTKIWLYFHQRFLSAAFVKSDRPASFPNLTIK